MYRRMVWELKLVGAKAKKSPRTVEFLAAHRKEYRRIATELFHKFEKDGDTIE